MTCQHCPIIWALTLCQDESRVNCIKNKRIATLRISQHVHLVTVALIRA